MAVYLSLTVLLLALTAQFYCICKYLVKINNLEVRIDGLHIIEIEDADYLNNILTVRLS